MLRNLSYVFAFITMVLINASPGMCAGSFSDDFSSGLSAWVTGTHPGVNDEPDIELHDGFCEFKQDYDYLETRQHFAGDFELVLDVSRQGPTNEDGNIWVQLTAAPELGAIFRFRYKRDNRESINIGRPPHESAEAHSWDTIDDGNYLRDLEDADPPHAGQLTVARENGKLRLIFTDDNGYTLETPFVPLASGDATAIRIWGTKNTGIDNVFIRYADTVDPVVGPAQDAGIAATVVPEGSTVPTSGRVLLAETFSGDLRDWNVGAHPNATAADEPQVLITNGACEFRETYHYLETRVGFYEGFRFSCDVEYDGPPPQQGNLWLQLVNSPGLGGIFRFPYGAGKTESISIGIPPHPSLVMGTWNSIEEGQELKQLTQAKPPHQGRLEFEYVDGQIALTYTDDAGNRVATPPVDVKDNCATYLGR
jgi:hypothetical protein